LRPSRTACIKSSPPEDSPPGRDTQIPVYPIRLSGLPTIPPEGLGSEAIRTGPRRADFPGPPRVLSQSRLGSSPG
jgi:hypothetical protein